MRRVLVAISFWLLAIGFINAQEAFYIYRNDGDFNGFFYDEVQELRYSQLSIDSIENDRYVTYEVVLADTIYRIPLAAIDSIGFQQPEVKFNPRVKFVAREGLSQYITQVDDSKVIFLNLPSNLTPQQGDVLIGLPTDANAKEKYKDVGGSFSCVVMGIEKSSGYLLVSGRPVESLAEVFEQFVTVEQIGVDKQGNIRRRIAGCTPDGFPRKAPAEDDGLNLINLSGTFTRSWNPDDNCSVDISADMNLIVRFRASYNINWWRFVASLSQEFITKVKPSFGLSYSRGFEFESNDLLPVSLGEIVFPAACPIFAVNPVPCLFVRGEGKAEARLKMPAVRLGIGMRYTYDTDNFFPLSCNLLLSEQKGDELTEDMLDLSAELSLSGYVQTGIKFSGDISTASWMKKVLRSAIGVYLYVGPKVGGTLSLAKADLNGGGLSLYKSLAASNLNVALPALDLEAKATVSVFSKDEKEKTFYNKSWAFFADTVFMAPSFRDPIVKVDDETMYVKLPSDQKACLGYQQVAVGLSRNDPDNPYVAYTTAEIPYDRKTERLSYQIPLASLRATEYEVYPLVKTWSFAPMEAEPKETVIVPPVVHFSQDSLIFGATTNLTQTIEVTSNVVSPDNIYASWTNEKEVVDAEKGKYRFTLTLPPNDRLFDYRVSKECPYYIIASSAKGEKESIIKKFPFAIGQQANDLPGFTFEFSANSHKCNNLYFEYEYPVTATRIGDNKIHVTGQYKNGDFTYNVDVYVIRGADIEGNDSYFMSGTVSKKYQYSYYEIDKDKETEIKCTHTETWTATLVPGEDNSVTVKAIYDYKLTGGGSTIESDHCEDPSCYWSASAEVHLP